MMPTEKQVTKSLDRILVPGVLRSLVKLNMVRQVVVDNHRVNISLASTALSKGVQDWLKDKVQETVGQLRDVKETGVDFAEASPKDLNEIGHVVAVMSGKGGVGKSLITSLISLSLMRHGYEVGILDADVTGPSIPRIFGTTGRPMGSETGILPVLSRTGIEIMSVNLLLQREDDAVIWRGPLITSTIRQFWDGVLWGKLDYLIIDLPPGTADASLTVAQSLPLAGVVIVFTPQELAAMVVRKTVQMANHMNVPILGVVENMSYFVSPESGKKLELFGKSKAQEMVKATKAPLLGRFPIDPEIARLCDEGKIERYESATLTSFGEAFLKAVPSGAKRPVKKAGKKAG